MRIAATFMGLLWALPGLAGEGEIRIDLSEQAMHVLIDAEAAHAWPDSTARAGKCTPEGVYGVQSMKRMHYSTLYDMHYSTLYDNAPMPWSIFFHGNYAIHGTTQTERLGTPASAGCVRLHPDDADALYGLVLEHGRENTVIEITE